MSATICPECQGSGKSWTTPIADHGVKDCPTCSGTGHLEATPTPEAEWDGKSPLKVPELTPELQRYKKIADAGVAPQAQPASGELAYEDATEDQKLDHIMEVARYGEGGGEGTDEAKALVVALLAQARTEARREGREQGLRHAVGAEIDPKWLRKALAELGGSDE